MDNSMDESKLNQNGTKDENHPKGHTQNEGKINKNMKGEKMQVEHVQKKKKMIPKVKKDEHQTKHTQNKNKITKNDYNSKKRKIDHTVNGSNKKRKFSDKKFKSNKEPSALESMTDDRLKAYGINPKKFRNKLKFGNNQ